MFKKKGFLNIILYSGFLVQSGNKFVYQFFDRYISKLIIFLQQNLVQIHYFMLWDVKIINKYTRPHDNVYFVMTVIM